MGFKSDKRGISEELLEYVRRYASCGMDYKRIAHLLRMNPEDLMVLRDEYPEIDMEYEYGQALCVHNVAAAMYESAVIRSNFSAQKFILNSLANDIFPVDPSSKQAISVEETASLLNQIINAGKESVNIESEEKKKKRLEQLSSEESMEEIMARANMGAGIKRMGNIEPITPADEDIEGSFQDFDD